MKKLIIIIAIVVAGMALELWYNSKPAIAPEGSRAPQASSTNQVRTSVKSIYDPSRVTKKMFGLYVSPGHSPVSPERFTGFHTGTDFETTPDEADLAVPVTAFCDGKLLLKKWASGYGGVAVESCTLNGQAVTVIYGHLNLGSITPAMGDSLKKNDFIGDLGKGYSTETDGERKHLHLGIHKGSSVNILGYVQNQSELSAWLDPAKFLP